jgi:hypothetical protein
LRDGKWKLVAEKTEKWQLFDIEKDRTELNNLIDKEPEVAKKLVAKYEAWYKRVGAEEFDKTFKWFYDYDKAKAEAGK